MGEALGQLLDISQNEDIKSFIESREKQPRGQRANEMGAREEGMEEGIAKGRAEGKEEGLEEGLAKGLKQVAQRMLLDGKDVTEIVRLTGLSKSTIQNLKG